MKQVIVLKLLPSVEQQEILRQTMQTFNAACQYVADLAYEKRIVNSMALQTLVYSELRSTFGLSSQMACLAVRKVTDAAKRDKRIHVRIDPLGAVPYDSRILSFKGLTQVSLLTRSGRMVVPIRFGAYQAARLGKRKGQADLVLKNGVFYLYVTIDIPESPPADTSRGVLGVGLGIVEIASDSEGNQYSGQQVKAVQGGSRRFAANYASFAVPCNSERPTRRRNAFAGCRENKPDLFGT